MDPASASPLFDLFRKGEVPREVRWLAAQGSVAPTVHEQLSILVLLTGDRDADVAAAARRTLDGLPREAVANFLTRPNVSDDVRAYFEAQGVVVGTTGGGGDSGAVSISDLERELEGLLATGTPEVEDPAVTDAADGADATRRGNIAMLPIIDKMKLAMRGTRDQRAVLIRDSNKLVSASVLSSPKVSESEIENFAKMANVSDDVLRIIGTNRAWTKSYAVIAALSKNPKTPPAISMPMVSRLNERDVKWLALDRNVPEGVRLAAKKLIAASESRRR